MPMSVALNYKSKNIFSFFFFEKCKWYLVPIQMLLDIQILLCFKLLANFENIFSIVKEYVLIIGGMFLWIIKIIHVPMKLTASIK